MAIQSAALLVALGLLATHVPSEPPAQRQDAQSESHGHTVPSLPLAFYSNIGLGEAVLDGFKREVERVLLDAGILMEDFSPELVGPAQQPTCGFPLRVVILRTSRPEWRLPPDTLGAVIGKSRPPNSVHLFHSVILRYLTEGANSRAVSDEALGRAFAYVAVHELVHAFAPEYKHSGWGIMGHEQDGRSLTQWGLTLDQRSAHALREGWRASRGC